MTVMIKKVSLARFLRINRTKMRTRSRPALALSRGFNHWQEDFKGSVMSKYGKITIEAPSEWEEELTMLLFEAGVRHSCR